MRIKILVFIMSVFLFLGLNAPASADWVVDDWGWAKGCGDAYLYNKDIMMAKVEVFDLDTGFTSFYDSLSAINIEEPWIYLCLKMCPDYGWCSVTEYGCHKDEDCPNYPSEYCAFGRCNMPPYGPCNTSLDCPEGVCVDMADPSTLPGVVVWELDVDSNSATGDPYSTLGYWDWPYKECSGFDLLIMQAFRTQTWSGYPDYRPSTMAWCRECDDFMPRFIGEWFAVPSYYGEYPPPEYWGVAAADWGRDIPKPPEGCTYNRYCTKLPYGEILKHSWLYGGYFDLAYALNHAPRWQVSTYWDPNYIVWQTWRAAGDGDDYYHPAWEDVNITDWLPSQDCNKAEGQISDGGTCHPLQLRFHNCMDVMADQRDYKNELARCQALGELACIADRMCTWWAAKSKCLPCDCFSDTNLDGKVSVSDFVLWKYETGRLPCPCQ